MLKCTRLSLSIHIYVCLPVVISLLLGSRYTALPVCPHSSAALHGTPCPVFAFPTSQVLMCTHITCENAAPASAGLGQGLECLHFQTPPTCPLVLPAAGLKLLMSVQLLAAFSPGRFSSSLLLTTRLMGQAMACAWTPTHHVSSSSQPHRFGFSQNTSSFIIFTPSQSSDEPAMTPLRRHPSFIITPTLQMKK